MDNINFKDLYDEDATQLLQDTIKETKFNRTDERIITDLNFQQSYLSQEDVRTLEFHNCDFRNSTFDNIDFTYADFYDCNFMSCTFLFCTFNETSFFNCNFEYGKIEYSQFKATEIERCNFQSVIFNDNLIHDCNIYRVNFQDSSFRDTIIKGNQFYMSDFCNTKILGRTEIDLNKISSTSSFLTLQCPETGSFIGYKLLADHRIAKLLILEDSKRSSATTRKCRASKVKVISITNFSGDIYYPSGRSLFKSFFYNIGEIIEIKDFNNNRWEECAPGIHFFITRSEAVNYWA